MTEPGALTAAINWYRAIPLSDLRASNQKISVPTMYVWSDKDIALLPKAAHDTGYPKNNPTSSPNCCSAGSPPTESTDQPPKSVGCAMGDPIVVRVSIAAEMNCFLSRVG
jgi:hypothetical protein